MIIATCALTALGYAAIWLSLLRLFRARNAAVLGGLRWVILAAVAGIIGLNLAALEVRGMSAVPALLLASALCQCAAGIALWPFLAGVETRLTGAVRARLRARMAQAEGAASFAYQMMALAEPAAGFGHWRIAQDTGALTWSDGMFRIAGLESDDMPQASEMANLLHTEDRAAFTANLDGLRAGVAFTQSARLRRPDGELRHVIIQACLANGDLAGVFVDATTQKLAEARMREANNVALQANAALREMSLEDNLTGLSNRRQFDLSLVHEFKRAVRSSLPLGLVLIDVDHFRAYNELYGPAAGDACLRQVAQVIRNIPRRAGDIVARYAGEEVALLLPLADDAGAETVARVIAEAVRAAAIPHAGSDCGFLTVSCGTASFSSVASLSNPLDLVRRADLALFKAKADGRDRVCRFELGLTNDLPMTFSRAVSPEMERIIKSRA